MTKAGRTMETSRQNWNAEHYASAAAFVPRLGEPLIELLAPMRGERILDLGCGDGVLTEKLAAAATVVGVDASAAMVAAARRRGIDARVIDARSLEFDSEFDAVFSNAALHWMDGADEVIAGVRRALRKGGRFVGEMGGHGNIAAIRVAIAAVLERRGIDGYKALPAWYFPTASEYRTKLEAGGFAVDQIELFARPTVVAAGMARWLDLFLGGTFALLATGERTAARDEVVAMLRPVLCDCEGRWVFDYVRLRFAARAV